MLEVATSSGIGTADLHLMSTTFSALWRHELPPSLVAKNNVIAISPHLVQFKASWELLVDDLLQEWKMFNLISALVQTYVQHSVISLSPIVHNFPDPYRCYFRWIIKQVLILSRELESYSLSLALEYRSCVGAFAFSNLDLCEECQRQQSGCRRVSITFRTCHKFPNTVSKGGPQVRSTRLVELLDNARNTSNLVGLVHISAYGHHNDVHLA